MIHVIAAVAVAGSGLAFAARHIKRRMTQTKPPTARDSRRPIEKFLATLRAGHMPTDGQFQAALLSCLVTRRLDTARRIADHHRSPLSLLTTLLDWSITQGRPDVTSSLHETFPELASEPPSMSDTEYHTKLPRPASPEWSAFLSALRTGEPGDDGPDHVGAYDHHKRRVSLYCHPSHLAGNEPLQIAVLTKDLHRLASEHPGLMLHVGTEVKLPDASLRCVTASGILSLLKCAGPRGAAQWLADERERTQFPTTTALFCACNDLF